MLLLSHLDRITPPSDVGTALDSALSGTAKLLRKRSLVFVISDFRAALWETPLSVLAARHDVVAIRIADAFDDALPRAGMIPFTDPETSYRAQFPTSSAEFCREWQKANTQRTGKWFTGCVKKGARPLVISTGTDPARSLAALFAAK
jgi:hypothetical protein